MILNAQRKFYDIESYIQKVRKRKTARSKTDFVFS